METKSLNNKGLTLMEVMVAFMIMAIGFMSMLYLSVFAVEASIKGKHIGNARFIAETQSEQLRSLDYRHPLLIDDGDTLDLDNTTTPDYQDSLARQDVMYTIMWNIAEDQPNSGIKTIKIHVLWDEKETQKHYEFTTFKGLGRR